MSVTESDVRMKKMAQDLQNTVPVGYCAYCGGEIYEGDSIYVAGRCMVHGECMEDYILDEIGEMAVAERFGFDRTNAAV